MGPGPFAAMTLADLGAEVIRVDRAAGSPPVDRRFEVNGRSRRSIAVDLKSESGRAIVLRLVAGADALIEGMRPGVTERLGLGPDDCLTANPALVYGRMTGWGQHGPYARLAGHDINYLAIAGALHPIGVADRPSVPPLNVVGDFGGGGMYLALGIVAGVLRARATGQGDVVDASIVDGVGALYGMIRGFVGEGTWADRREANLLDGGTPYYRTYRCADGKEVAVGALEPQFWAELVKRIGLADDPLMSRRDDRSCWPQLQARLAEHFATRTRDEWVELTEDSDACLTPVLSLAESLADPHLRARNAFRNIDGSAHPAPAPRFRRAGERAPTPTPMVGEHTAAILADLGYSDDEVDALRAAGAIR
ncbi:CaiB/BaiF CoA transferase family protein [Nocardia sp. NPDC004068]|uniref:CaiB/BaiF CoA transferase family protein n=1 Tax=Nocardia sp. NPDC004068 TaxID=3364303 RepID=UPI00367619CD